MGGGEGFEEGFGEGFEEGVGGGLLLLRGLLCGCRGLLRRWRGEERGVRDDNVGEDLDGDCLEGFVALGVTVQKELQVRCSEIL